MQCVLAVRETVVIKPSRLNVVAHDHSTSLPVPSLSPYTHLSLSKRERSHIIYTKHTPSGKADGVALHYTCPTPSHPWNRACIGPAHEAGLSTGTKEEKVPPRKKEELHDLEIRGRGRWMSLKMSPFYRSYMTFGWSATVNIALFCTIFELFDVE